MTMTTKRRSICKTISAAVHSYELLLYLHLWHDCMQSIQTHGVGTDLIQWLSEFDVTSFDCENFVAGLFAQLVNLHLRVVDLCQHRLHVNVYTTEHVTTCTETLHAQRYITLATISMHNTPQTANLFQQWQTVLSLRSGDQNLLALPSTFFKTGRHALPSLIAQSTPSVWMHVRI